MRMNLTRLVIAAVLFAGLAYAVVASPAFTLAVVAFSVGVLLSIALHEVGHLLPAKIFGVPVSQYMVGFGPTLWSRMRGETEYGIKAIPLGGYVKLVGMVPPAHEVAPVKGRSWWARVIRDTREAEWEDIPHDPAARYFWRLPAWKKLIVMGGGTFTNLLIAALIFVGVGSGYGVPTFQPQVAAVTPCALESVYDTCEEGDEPSAASKAGLEVGDRILALDGVEVASWADLTQRMRDALGRTVTVDIDRDGDVFSVEVAPTARDYFTFDAAGEPLVDAEGEFVLEPTGFFGVQPAQARERVPVATSLGWTGEAVVAVGNLVINLPEHMASAARAIAGVEERDAEGAQSIVGAAVATGELVTSVESFADRVVSVLVIVGSVNIALFVFNMIPLPPFDGGHMAGAVWQAVKNGVARLRGHAATVPVDVARTVPLAYAVYAFLIVFGVVLIVADIVAPVSFV